MNFEYAIALTGSIATGKSTVASLLGLNGMRVIDADAISHQILEENQRWVIDNFGDKYIRSLHVDRPALGRLIFQDNFEKKKLEDFLHPLIRTEIKKRADKQDGFKFPYLIDIPLFFEKQGYEIKDSVVVYTPPEIQLKRFMKRDGFTKEQSLRRINSQIPIDEKKKRATWVIDNSIDLPHLQSEVEQFVANIKKRYR